LPALAAEVAFGICNGVLRLLSKTIPRVVATFRSGSFECKIAVQITERATS
jgi:hypothetical protein